MQKCPFPKLGPQTILDSCSSLLPHHLLATLFSFGGQTEASFFPISLPPPSCHREATMRLEGQFCAIFLPVHLLLPGLPSHPVGSLVLPGSQLLHPDLQPYAPAQQREALDHPGPTSVTGVDELSCDWGG